MKTPQFKALTQDEFKALASMEEAWDEYSSVVGETARYAKFQVLLERQPPKWMMPAMVALFAILICLAPSFWRVSVPADITVSEKSAINIANHVNSNSEKVDLGPVLAEFKKIPVTPATDLKPVLEAVAKLPSASQNAEATASSVGHMITDGFIGEREDLGKIRFFLFAGDEGTAQWSWLKEEASPAIATTSEEKKE